MVGETNLDELIRSMSAVLIDGLYVFVTVELGRVPKGISPRPVPRRVPEWRNLLQPA
ncbi:MAG: ACT domain-containing protein [Paracoccaceae bacterium]